MGSTITASLLVSAALIANAHEASADTDKSTDTTATLTQLAEAHHFDDRNSRVLIVSVGSSVYSDFDNDGFFTNFSLRFDADVDYGDEWVYADIYLRAGDANYEFFHSSDSFEIYESLSTDEYHLDSELVRNYPAGYYDVRIELRDAYNDSLLDVVDASTNRTLFALPLESADFSGFDTAVDTQSLAADANGNSVPGTQREQIVHESVGASYAVLPLLLAGWFARRGRKPKG